jgi:predicted permease
LQLFLDILTGITLPILTLVAVGYGVQRRYSFDVATLTRMQVYVLIPGALVYFPSAAKLPLETVWPILGLSLVHFASMFGLGWLVARAFRMSRGQVALMALVAMFSNSGNYGIPLVQLTFPEDYLLYQSVVLALHSALIAPLALLVMERKGDHPPGLWGALFGTPLLPAVALGYLLKGFDVTLPQDAFTPMALLLLGVQLASIEGKVERSPLVLGVVLRMIVAPATAWLFAVMAGFPPLLIAFFVVSAAVPAAGLVAIFAHEFRSEPALASTIVFLSTVVSALTVTCWVYAVRYGGLQ